MILMLLDDNRQEHFSKGAKGSIAVEFFRDLFTSSNPYDLETLFQGFNTKVTDEMNAQLTALVTPAKIRDATFCVKGCSAPGEDGLLVFSTDSFGILLVLASWRRLVASFKLIFFQQGGITPN